MGTSSPQPVTNQPTSPFARKLWQVRLEDEVSDDFYTTRDGSSGEGKTALPTPGAERYEHSYKGAGVFTNIRADGPCFFRWGVNRSGSTLAVGEIARRSADLAVTVDATGTVTTLEDGSAFVANEEVGNLLYILNWAAVAGAAPEGEWARIIKNDADVLTFQPAMTVATLSTDTAVIYRNNHLTLLGGAIQQHEVFGVTVRPSGVQDNYWGWFCCKGLVETLVVAASTAITTHVGLIGAAGGRLTNSSTSLHDVILAKALGVTAADTAKRTIPVFFDVLTGMSFTSA